MNMLEETEEMLLVKRKSNIFSQARLHSNFHVGSSLG
jgi:hypothetical protein